MYRYLLNVISYWYSNKTMIIFLCCLLKMITGYELIQSIHIHVDSPYVHKFNVCQHHSAYMFKYIYNTDEFESYFQQIDSNGSYANSTKYNLPEPKKEHIKDEFYQWEGSSEIYDCNGTYTKIVLTINNTGYVDVVKLLKLELIDVTFMVRYGYYFTSIASITVPCSLTFIGLVIIIKSQRSDNRYSDNKSNHRCCCICKKKNENIDPDDFGDSADLSFELQHVV